MQVYGDAWEWWGLIFKHQASITMYFNGIQFDASADTATAAATATRCEYTCTGLEPSILGL